MLSPERFTVREEQFFLVVAVMIGLASGLSVVCFRICIELARIKLLGSGLRPTFPRVVLAPTLTGLVVAALVILLFPRARGSGVNQTKAALYIYDGFIPFSTIIGKFITAGWPSAAERRSARKIRHCRLAPASPRRSDADCACRARGCA